MPLQNRFAHRLATAGLIVGVFVVLVAPAVADDAPSPEARLGMLERSLVESPSVQLDFAVTATGAVDAELAGSLSLDGDAMRLDATGSFAGREMTLEIRTTEEGRLIGGYVDAGDSAPRFDVELPAHLREAVAIGFTRMGILHNLALLAGGRMPDHADVGIGDWLILDDFAAAEPHGGHGGVMFDLSVGGEPAADDVGLWIDSRGHPTVRRQVVQFPQGEMRVLETYTEVDLGE
ncbi:MAG: hypothetical protein AAGE94_09305 [Acidobacteriota bacterium]